jgi:poly(3-hydroxybutyrate) depolymerase
MRSGEPAIIAGIAQTVQSSSTWNIDKDRTYITGLSAGAAMSVIGEYAKTNSGH